MSAKIISSHRYKKTTRKKAEIKKEQKYKYLNNKEKNKIKYLKEKQKKEKKFEKKLYNNRIDEAKLEVDNLLNLKSNEKFENKKNKRSNSLYIPKAIKIAGLVFFLGIIAIISKQITTNSDSLVVKVFSNRDSNNDFVKDYELKLGITGLDTTSAINSKNVVVKELESLSYGKLLTVNNDYSISYIGASTVDKVSNKEYNILLNDKSGITNEDLKISIESIKNAGENSIYYKYIKNIESVEDISDKQVKIRLFEDNPYFVYTLDFPIISAKGKSSYNYISSTDNKISFERKDINSAIKSITLLNYLDSDDMVKDFRNDIIDVFFTSSSNAMQLIGKHEYNLKKYRNGETIFILGNKNSQIYSKKEIRQAIVYSLNRDEIVKDINGSFGEVIDLPFIYSQVKYKYDIYGAKNVLELNSWSKNSDGIYQKTEDFNTLKAELNLLVNKDDEDKLKIAEKVKQMCSISGITINIEQATDLEIQEKVSYGNYDMVLADILVDDYPDISYLQNFLDIDTDTNTAILQVKNSNVQDLPQNILNLQNVLSEEVSCIGIFARNINVVYQKNITGFDNVRYLKIFENIEKMGKYNDKIGG